MDTWENRENTSNLSNDEVAQAAALLARLDAGFLPFPVFLQVCRLATVSTLELVVVRRNAAGEVEVWLRQRSPEDALWADKWCNPGCIIRPTDTLEMAFDRLAEDDMNRTAFTAAPVFVQYMLNPANVRGQVSIALHWVELEHAPDVGRFFPVRALPPDLIPHQKELIVAAAKAYADAR